MDCGAILAVQVDKMDHKNFYSMLLVSFRREDRQGLLILPKTLLHHLCRNRGWEQAEGTRRSETNGHFFPLFSHVFTRHPVAFPSGAARCGLDPPYVPAETSDPKPCHRHRLFLACLETASFFNPSQVFHLAHIKSGHLHRYWLSHC